MSNEVTIPGAGAELTLSDLSPMVAAELAAGLSSPKTIRERYGLSMAQWQMLAKNESFRRMLAEAITRFKGDLNAGARITLKAETLLEDAMPELYHVAKSQLAPATDKINAIKQLAELAGRGPKATQQAPGGSSGFVLNINVGKGQGVTIEGQKLETPE